jgi:GNAT superfamily N-acetyltransferase
MTITIRTARFDDEVETLALIEELFVAPGRRPSDYTRERASEGFRRAVTSERADVLLAFDDGRPVGAATVYLGIFSIRYGQRCFVEDLIVLPDQRSKGTGKLLLEAAGKWGRERGCDFIQLHSGNGRKDAHRFYERQGMDQDSLVFTKHL